MRVQNPEEILVKMASLLKEAGVLEQEKTTGAAELNAMAGSIMVIADQLDRAGAEIAASRLDDALGRLAEAGCRPDMPELDNAEADRNIVLKAATTTLIRIADRLDDLEATAAQDVDRALAALAGRCMCQCPMCAKKRHCRNADTHCYADDSE